MAKKYIKNIALFLAGGLIGVASTLTAINCLSNSKLPIERDMNGDGRPDIVVREATKTQDAYILMQRKDGQYDTCNMTIEDGFPVYPLLDNSGFYDFCGSFFKNTK